MELVYIINSNLGELSNKKSEIITDTFHNSMEALLLNDLVFVNIDVNPDQLIIRVTKKNVALNDIDDLANKINSLSKNILDSIFIDTIQSVEINYARFEYIDSDFLKQNESLVKHISENMIGIGRTYKLRKNNFEINYNIEPSFNPNFKNHMYYLFKAHTFNEHIKLEDFGVISKDIIFLGFSLYPNILEDFKNSNR